MKLSAGVLLAMPELCSCQLLRELSCWTCSPRGEIAELDLAPAPAWPFSAAFWSVELCYTASVCSRQHHPPEICQAGTRCCLVDLTVMPAGDAVAPLLRLFETDFLGESVPLRW